MESKFKIGDVVILKSGSQRMVVDDVDEIASTVQCVWMDTGIVSSRIFKQDILVGFISDVPTPKPDRA